MNEKQLPDESIETLARSFYKDSQDYGFHDNDYLRSANMLLDLSMKKESTPHEEQQREGVKISFNDLISNESNIIGVITLLDDSPIGSVTFLDYDRRQQKAELKKLVGQREKRGMGLAKEATKLWIEYGIRALGLKKIYLNTLFTNVRNIRLNEDLGFQVEGILRNEIFFEGKHYDVLRMGLWRD